jgi:hypothetical protein
MIVPKLEELTLEEINAELAYNNLPYVIQVLARNQRKLMKYIEFLEKELNKK